MKTWMKVLLVTLLFGLPTVPLGQIIWQSPAAAETSAGLNGLQLALFIGLGLCEGLAFGLGIAFLLFGMPLVQRATGNAPLLTWATYAGIAWWLVSWWPHDNFHRTVGNIDSLLMLEYGFHVTLMLAAAIVAFTFLRLLSRMAVAPEVRAPRAGTLPEVAVR